MLDIQTINQLQGHFVTKDEHREVITLLDSVLNIITDMREEQIIYIHA